MRRRAAPKRVMSDRPRAGHMGAARPPRVRVAAARSADDIRRVMPLARALHRESRYRVLPYDVGRAESLLMRAVDAPDRWGLLIAERPRDGRAVGFLHCTVGPFVAGGGMLASILALFVDPAVRKGLAGGEAALRLLEGYRAWAIARGAVEAQVSVTSSIDIKRADRFLRRAGFTVTGANYALPLSDGREGATEPR